MTLAGTRPPTVDEFEQYSAYHKKRLCRTPGLTGVWQVSGRSNITDFEEIVKMDVEYIENWSLYLGFKRTQFIAVIITGIVIWCIQKSKIEAALIIKVKEMF